MDGENIDIDKNVIQSLDQCRRFTEQGAEYWSARDIQQLLKYSKWSSFEELIERAKQSCVSAGYDKDNHFADGGKMVTLGSSSLRNVKDVALSRYACYLIAMNGDTSKTEIAIAQAYFAGQTYKQELFEQLSEDQKRLMLRDRVKKSHRKLGEAAKNAGVIEYGLFYNAGYRGLYDGLGVDGIKQKKGIPQKDNLLDCIGREELALNDFRLTQTESKLNRNKIKGDAIARETHHEVAREVRNTIKKIGGTMPEDLPREPSIKQLKKPEKPKELPSSST